MSTAEMLWCVIGMAAVTAVPRILPLTLLAGRTLPEAVVRCLSFVPVAVLAALLAPEVLLSGTRLHLGLDNLYLLAAIPTWLVARYANSFFGAIVTGMLAVALGRMTPFFGS